MRINTYSLIAVTWYRPLLITLRQDFINVVEELLVRMVLHHLSLCFLSYFPYLIHVEFVSAGKEWTLMVLVASLAVEVRVTDVSLPTYVAHFTSAVARHQVATVGVFQETLPALVTNAVEKVGKKS